MGGGTETVIELVRGQRRLGLDTYGAAGAENDADRIGADVARASGLEITLIPNLVRELRPLADIKAYREIRRELRRVRPDVLHTHTAKAGVLGRLAGILGDVPIVAYTVHGWTFGRSSGLVGRAYEVVERLLARFTDIIFVVAEHDRDVGLTRQIGSADKYVLTRSAIDLTRFRPPSSVERIEARRALGLPPPPDREVIGTVTRFAEHKHAIQYVRLARELRFAGRDTVVAIVGDGPERPRLEALIHAERLEDHIKLLGMRRDIPTCLAALDLFVLADLFGGLPRALVEALATGLPVVSTTFAGVPEVVHDGVNGYLVPVGDLSLLVDRASKLLEDDEMRSQFAAAAPRAVRGFAVEEMVQRTVDAYAASRRAIAGQPGHDPGLRRTRSSRRAT